MTPRPRPTPSSRIRRLLIGAFVFPLLAASLLAQSFGTITGRVYDERTGQSLEGAIVRVVGTNAQDYTTNDGRFSVSAPAGQAQIEVEYVGLDTLQQSFSKRCRSRPEVRRSSMPG